MTELAAALADHHRVMYLREEVRLSGGAWREARAAITAPRSALETLTSAGEREKITSHRETTRPQMTGCR
ncbi:hypothetical protein ACWCV5_33595 [Streptomyces tubercidicus]